MDSRKLHAFRKQLLEQRQSLADMVASLAEAARTVELDQTRVGRLTRMDALQGQQMALEAERRRKQKLLAIEAALRRIENGRFGLCAGCDEAINPRRLEADPTHALCIECASGN